MKWLLVALVALAVLVILVAVIGALMPRDHLASSRARYTQSPESVWAAITGVEAFPKWRAGVSAVEVHAPIEGRRSWVEIGRQGRLPLEAVEERAPSHLVLRIADAALPFGGTWTYEIAADRDGSTLTITERGQIYNPIFRFMARTVFGYHSTMDAFLASLGTRFGESVRPEHLAEGARR